MSADEMREMAERCLEMMRTMGAMMGMQPDSGAMSPSDGMQDMAGMDSFMGPIGGLGLLIVPLLLLSVLLIGLWLVRRRHGPGEAAASEAMTEADRRYARGELDRDAYLTMRRDLVEGRS